MMARKNRSTINDALKVVGGGIFGAGLALLLAPCSGRETRRNIAGFTKTTVRKTDRVVHDVAGNIAGFAGTVGDRAAGLLRSGQETLARRKKSLVRLLS